MPLYPNVERLILRETGWKPFEQTGIMSANTTKFTAEDHIEASSSSSWSAFSTAVVSSCPLSKLGVLCLGPFSDVDPPESLPNRMKCLKKLDIQYNGELKYLSPKDHVKVPMEKIGLRFTHPTFASPLDFAKLIRFPLFS
ncbi:hypothetical protein PanWU01x14_067580 [Parasponia andersonii]|uniref:LRR domain containing protein n=1 Tax=Parasponia andersonii TaxID=3476 RepID=A0A2P5DGG5_PARAD|nr:hypothetical protein PanWU01x14_067580 [Parasponia andersonii]